jgi:hypothetical protein
MRLRVLLGGIAAVLVTLLGMPPAGAAGIITHAWMAEEAVGFVGDPALVSLLRAQRDQLLAGADFPDGGYATRDAGVPGGDFGEEAHWHRFHAAYLDVLRARTDCGTVTDPSGPCAGEIAHLMGVAAHGMGDELWDWLFEPRATDHGELWIPPELSGTVKPGGIEVQMDAIAVTDHGRGGGPSPAEPAPADVLAAFTAAGRPGISAEALDRGRRTLDDVRGLLVAGSPAYRDAVHAHMPWTSANIATAPGGIRFSARAIAVLYETLWARLLRATPLTRVAVTAPADGSVDVPATGWDRTFKPGAWPDTGGADNRIAAALSWGLPFVPPGAPAGTHVPAELPEGAAVLTERDTSVVIPLQRGYPRIVPYDPDYGGHLIAVQPAADLSPCTWYRVATTDRLRDADGRAVQPASWGFRTAGCPAPVPVRGEANGGVTTQGPGIGPAPTPTAVSATPRYTG